MYTLQIYKYTYRYFEWHACHWEEVQLAAITENKCGIFVAIHSQHHFSQSMLMELPAVQPSMEDY